MLCVSMEVTLSIKKNYIVEYLGDRTDRLLHHRPHPHSLRPPFYLFYPRQDPVLRLHHTARPSRRLSEDVLREVKCCHVLHFVRFKLGIEHFA